MSCSTIKPLRNNILFIFLDETSGPKGKFTDRKTKEGIILPILDSTQKHPRWGKVLAVGPDTTVKVGEYILIEGLQWTFGVKLDDVKMWKTDDSRVIVVTDDLMDTYVTY